MSRRCAPPSSSTPVRARFLHCPWFMAESRLSRLESIRTDIYRRLRTACSYMESDDFDELVKKMADLHLRFEQYRNRHVAEVAVEPVTSREPGLTSSPYVAPARLESGAESAQSDGERNRRFWLDHPTTNELLIERKRR